MSLRACKRQDGGVLRGTPEIHDVAKSGNLQRADIERTDNARLHHRLRTKHFGFATGVRTETDFV